MRRTIIQSCLITFACLACSTFGLPATSAQDTDSNVQTMNWAQWRGPNGDGSSDWAKPPVEFSDEKNVKWKAEIPGKGSSTPIIWGDYVYVLTAVDTKKAPPTTPETDEGASGGRTNRAPQTRTAAVDPESNRSPQERPRNRGRRGRSRKPTTLHDFNILCFNKDTGEHQWTRTLNTVVPHETGHATNNFASTTPVTNGENIFVNYGSRGVFCLDMNGQVVWEKDFGQMRTRNSFGEGSSPALHGNTLVVPWDQEEQSYMIALDTATGDVKWQVERDEPTTWATPLIVEHGGKVQVVTNGTTVRSYDLETGDVIWECGGQASNPIPTPIQLGDHVICMTGYRGFAIVSMDLDSKGDITKSDAVAWSSNDAAPYVPSGVLYDGKLYYTKSNDAMIAALDANDGEEYMELTRLPKSRQVYASLVAADGKIYACSREGTVVVLKHGPELEVLSINEMGETIDASPSLIGNRIYLRGEKNLFCIEEN